jgi:RimJ/RimL family protein N-acetyltransferase
MGNYIRYANKEDADILGLINSKSAQQGFKGIIPDDFLKEKFSHERLRDRLYKELEEGSTTSCIIFSDDVPAGMLTIGKDDHKQRDDSEIDLWRVYLLPEYWGKNIAGELIDWVTEELRRKGYKKIGLWVVEENARARRFYEKAGFIHVGEIRNINPGRELRDYRYIKCL